MSKVKEFRKKAVIWTMIITLLIVAACGLGFGTVVEATLAEEIAKWVVGALGLSCITGFFAFIISPVVWSSKHGEEENEEEE